MHDGDETRLIAVTRDDFEKLSEAAFGNHWGGTLGERDGLATRLNDAFDAGITEQEAAHLDHALHPDRCSDCEGLSRRLRHAFGHFGSEKWPWS